jgi:hypothetical protein
LGTSDPFFLNAPVYAHFTTIPFVTATVSESEHAGVFANGQVAVEPLTNAPLYPASDTPKPPTPSYATTSVRVVWLLKRPGSKT